METLRKWVMTLAVLMLAVAALLASLRGWMPEARAQDEVAIVCNVMANANETQAWLNKQVSGGKKSFTYAGAGAYQGSILCAW